MVTPISPLRNVQSLNQQGLVTKTPRQLAAEPQFGSDSNPLFTTNKPIGWVIRLGLLSLPLIAALALFIPTRSERPAVVPANPTQQVDMPNVGAHTVTLQTIQGHLRIAEDPGIPGDPEPQITGWVHDAKSRKTYWLVPDAFNGNIYGDLQSEEAFKAPGVKDRADVVIVGLPSTNRVKLSNKVSRLLDDYLPKAGQELTGHQGSPFVVQRIQGRDGKVLWENKGFKPWLEQVLGKESLRQGLLQGDGIALQVTPTPNNP